MSPVLLVERVGPVEFWTLNLPEARNPITGDDMVSALVAAVDDVNVDREVRAVVLTGAGDAFVGALAARLAAGFGLADAVEVAVAAGSFAVGALGAQASYPGPADLGLS